MAHNDYVNPAGQWLPETVPEPGMMRRLDQQISEGVNGDAGGTWNPANPIVIGGSGVQAFSTGGISGAIKTGKNAASGGALILGDSDYPTLSPSVTKTTLVPIRDFFTRGDRREPEDEVGLSGVTTGASAFFPYTASTPGTVTNDTFETTIGLHAKPTYLIAPIDSLDLVQGATITEIALLLSVRQTPSAIATVLPGFRVLRLFGDGSFGELYKIPNRGNTTGYLVDDLVIPSSPNGRQFRCTVAGTSGGSQPAAFGTATVGQAVTDGGVTWVCETGPTGATGHFCTLRWSATTSAYYAGGATQSVLINARTGLNTAGPAFNHIVALDTNIGAQYAFEIYDTSYSNNYAYHALKITQTVDKLRATY